MRLRVSILLIWWLCKSSPLSPIHSLHTEQNTDTSFYRQWFNLLTTRTRRLSILQQPPLFNKRTQNIYLFPAILFSLVMAFFWLYIPALQNVLGTTGVPVEYWFLPAAFGMGILLVDEGRKWLVRIRPEGWVAKCAW